MVINSPGPAFFALQAVNGKNNNKLKKQNNVFKDNIVYFNLPCGIEQVLKIEFPLTVLKFTNLVS